MAGLQGAIAGRWLEIRESARSLHDITYLLRPSQAALAEHASRLRHAVEQGTVEYKRAGLQQVFVRLEEMSYRSVSSGVLQALEHELDLLTWSTVVQKLISEGKISIAHETPEEPHNPSLEVREIMAQVQQAAQKDPAVKSDPAIKNILLQITKYRNEAERLRKLTQKAPEKQRAAILQNFQSSFAEIFASIKKNYAEFAHHQALKDAPPSRNPLERYRISAFTRLYLPQAEKLTRLRATITYVRREQEAVRGTLLRLTADKQTVFATVRAELDAYEHATGSRRLARQLARAFALEIISTIERERR